MKAKTKNRLLFAVAGLTLAVAVCAGVGTAGKHNAFADMEKPNYYAETYNSGTVIPVKSRTVKYGGKEYTADVIVLAPDGNAYRTENFTATMPGVYTVEYRITVDGAVVKTSEKFTVNKTLFEVTSSRSSAECSTFSYDTKAGETVTMQGIDLNLASGDTFYYNKIIDLSKMTVEDCALGLFAVAKTEGTADLLKLVVTFTDIYDPTNVVNVELKTMDKGNVDSLHYSQYRSWMSAGASYQPSTGIDRNNAGAFIYNGNIYYKWAQHLQYGFPVTHSFYGTPYNASTGEFLPVGSEQLEIYWDYDERQLYGPATTYNPTRLIADLDDATFFTEVWQGFTTGEVTVSITGANYVSSSARLFITDIAGGDLSQNVLTDNAPPQITVDTLGYKKDELPVAKVGKPYALFPSMATDDYDGATDVTVNVFYNYRTNNEVLVEVDEGTFTPFATGRYEIVYSAKDVMGKKSQRSFSVEAVAGKELTIDFVEEGVAEAVLGREARVPNYQIVNASGKAQCNVTAKLADTDTVYEVKEGKFIPLYAGEYTLTYAYADYLEEKSATKTLTVENSDEPTILEELTGMPTYLLKNCVYELPILSGIVFENGEPVARATEISVKENGKIRTLANNYFAPQVEGEVEVIYTVKADNGKSYQKAFPLQVVDVGYAERLRMEKYFVGNAQVEATQQCVEVYADKDAYAQFVTPMQVYEYQSRMQVNVARNDYSRVTVRMQDTQKPDVTVAFHFTRGKDGTLFSVNDDTFTYSLGRDCFIYELESITCNYSNLTRAVTFDNATYVSVTTDEAGRPFEGFTGNIAYVTYCVSNVEVGGEAGLRIYLVNEQPFNKTISDSIKPQLFVLGKDSGLKKVGDRLYIAPSFARDVLDPNVSISFAVYDPEGNICTSEDGVVLNAEADHAKGYYVVAKRLGTYMVRYQVCDGKGNKTTDSYALNVVDKEPPEITVSAVKSTAKVGEKISLPKATAKDNCTENVKVRVYVYYPNGSMYEITESSFVATEAGTYKVTYFAMDELMNTAMKTFVVTVS